MIGRMNGCLYALTPNTVELIPALGALSPRGGPVQDPVLKGFEFRLGGWGPGCRWCWDYATRFAFTTDSIKASNGIHPRTLPCRTHKTLIDPEILVCPIRPM